MKVRRDHLAMERRRTQAATLFRDGYTPAEVAKRFGISRQSACRWKAAWERDGTSGLASKGAAGRKTRLTPEQREQVIVALIAGPIVQGYQTNLWTLPRVALLVKDLTGVSYHPGHVWHLLRALDFSCQRPTRRAIERNEEKIAHWKQKTWPKIKKKPGAKGG